MPVSGRPLGILAGAGSLPREIADIATQRGQRVFLVGIAGEAEPSFAPFPHVMLHWGSIGGIVQAFRAAGVRELLLVGGVRRPDLLRLRPDLGFWRALPTILRLVRAGGDDGVLRGVVGFFEREGFQVVGLNAVAPEIVVQPGCLGQVAPASADLTDIELGREVVRQLGAYDIGQAVVLTGGRLVAVEGAEGTDGMLQRLARQRLSDQRPGAGGGVLVKMPKPGQDLRIDLPAIGPGTVRAASAARLAGIAVEAGAVVAARRRELVAAADQAGVFVIGCGGSGGCERPAGRPRGRSAGQGRHFALEFVAGRVRGSQLVADAAKGAGVAAALAAYDAGRAVVVARGHVLSVEAGEGAAAAITRAASLRQWGGRGRRGVAVVSRATEVDADLIAGAAEAGLAALVLPPGAVPRAAAAALRRSATQHGIAVAALVTEDRVA